MDGSSFFYIVALVVALIPFGVILGSYLLYARTNRFINTTVRVNRHFVLRQLGATTLLVVDMDCVRTNHAAHALAVARRAGMRICLTTQGAARTAAAVRIGYADTAKAITVMQGKEVRNKSSQELGLLFRKDSVFFSHLTPEDKVHLITYAQQEGEIVTVATADNADVLPLEYATVGVVMGNTMSTQTERVSDVIVKDGDITTLIGALQTGRVAIINSRKALVVSLIGNAAAVGTILISWAVGIMSHVPPAVSLIQILVITGLAGILPALLAAGDKHEGNPMHHSPRIMARRAINYKEGLGIAWYGLLISGLAYGNYLLFFGRNNLDAGYLTAGSTVHNSAAAVGLITTILCLLVYTAHQRSAHGLFARHQRHNRVFWLGVSLVAGIIMLLPFAPLPSSAGLVLLGGIDWFYIIGSTIVFLTLCEFQRHNRKHHRKAVLALHQSIHARSPR